MNAITIHQQHGLAYTDDYAAIRAQLKNADDMTLLCDMIERDALCLVADITTPDGRQQIRENADWVKKAARRLEKIRTEAVADLKREPKAVEDAVRPHLKRLEALAAEIAAPVLAIDHRSDSLRVFSETASRMTHAPLHELKHALAEAQRWDDSAERWQERATEAPGVKAAVVEALTILTEKAQREADDMAELTKLRAEKEMRERIEREKSAQDVRRNSDRDAVHSSIIAIGNIMANAEYGKEAEAIVTAIRNGEINNIKWVV